MTREPAEPEGRFPATGIPVGALQGAYLQAILGGEMRAAERVIRDAIDRGLTEGTIDAEIIAPAMAAVGDGWAGGELSVADEHLATDISLRMIALQRESFRVAHRRSSATVLLAAVEGERHVVGLEMAASALLHAGFDVRMLGPDVPGDAIAAAVARVRPCALGLTATAPEMIAPTLDAVDLARRQHPSLGVVIGGAAAESVVRVGPGIALCTHVGDAADVVDALAQRAALN